MVTSVNNHVDQECQEWIEVLRNDRSLLIEQQATLQSMVASNKIPHDQLPSVDHFENQFDIQLTNVNHLKHAIKEHLHTLEVTPSTQLSAPHFTVHESLSDQFQGLSSTIDKLKLEFSNFYHTLQATKE
jgi:hypothetical protein